MTNKIKKSNQTTITAKDVVDDLDYIAEMLSLRTGTKVGRTNAARAALKAWFDAENNG
tara:strand:- start:515 stop:688 length:174 start_codon:yes stop_codon:yes gene_type:complete